MRLGSGATFERNKAAPAAKGRRSQVGGSKMGGVDELQGEKGCSLLMALHCAGTGAGPVKVGAAC